MHEFHIIHPCSQSDDPAGIGIPGASLEGDGGAIHRIEISGAIDAFELLADHAKGETVVGTDLEGVGASFGHLDAAAGRGGDVVISPVGVAEESGCRSGQDRTAGAIGLRVGPVQGGALPRMGCAVAALDLGDGIAQVSG